MSGIFDAYAAGGARSFFGADYADADDRRRRVATAARPLAPAVADALAAQNARLAPSTARDENLAALRRGAAAVVTGQQVGLFLGPLFTLYKAASAIRAARALAAESGHPVVPIFWLQNEDHDLPEIAECYVPGAAGAPLALRIPCAPQRTSLAHIALPAAVTDCLAHLRAEIGALPHGEEHLARLERHYRPGTSWTDAFAGLLAELFAGEGLVLLDPRDAVMAAAAAPVHRRGLEQAEAIAGALVERTQVLAAAGFTAPVHVRPGAPLSFFHPAGPQGARFRLEPAAGGFAEVGGARVHSRPALLAALEHDPLCFSSSALLRPIVQDTLLPTAAYVAGPGEVAYFAQLAPLYEAFALPMPLVVPRARLRVIEERTAKLLGRLGLQADAAAAAEDDVLAACIREAGGADRDVSSRLFQPFADTLRQIEPDLDATGPGIHTAVEKTRAAVGAAVAKLAEKVEKARLHRDQERVREVRLLRHLLYPNGVPQERCYGISYFAARYGERAFVERVLETIAPFDARPRDFIAERGDAPRVAERGNVLPRAAGEGQGGGALTQSTAQTAGDSPAVRRPLSIGIVCYPSFGGSGVVAAELAVGLAQRGHRVHVIASAPPSRALPQCDRLLFHEVSASDYPLFDQSQYALAVASAIVEVTREHQLDLVQVHYAVPHAASAYLARQVLGNGAPRFVTTMHGTDVTRVGMHPSYQSITHFTVAASDALTVPSAFLRREAHRLLGLGSEPEIEVIPNFVDTDHFAPAMRRDRARVAALFAAVTGSDAEPEGPILFHVSNFRAVKRVADLMEVLLRVRRRLPARLVLVGDGPERAHAAQRARELGVAASVCFLGKRADFTEALQQADAFVLPSESESFGVAAAEALSAGVPVFGYRVGGLPEVVAEGTGHLVDPFDVDALAAAVVDVIGDPGRQAAFAAAARAHALARFRREPALDRYEACFRRVLERAPRKGVG